VEAQKPYPFVRNWTPLFTALWTLGGKDERFREGFAARGLPPLREGWRPDPKGAAAGLPEPDEVLAHDCFSLKRLPGPRDYLINWKLQVGWACNDQEFEDC
jgi:hypothetical protein